MPFDSELTAPPAPPNLQTFLFLRNRDRRLERNLAPVGGPETLNHELKLARLRRKLWMRMKMKMKMMTKRTKKRMTRMTMKVKPKPVDRQGKTLEAKLHKDRASIRHPYRTRANAFRQCQYKARITLHQARHDFLPIRRTPLKVNNCSNLLTTVQGQLIHGRAFNKAQSPLMDPPETQLTYFLLMFSIP